MRRKRQEGDVEGDDPEARARAHKNVLAVARHDKWLANLRERAEERKMLEEKLAFETKRADDAEASLEAETARADAAEDELKRIMDGTLEDVPGAPGYSGDDMN